MPTLSLLRHAKSGWDDPVETDFDRPLNGRGHRAARRIGRFMQEEGLSFDRVLASPAVRVRQTLEGVEVGYGAPLDPRFDRQLYLAPAELMLEMLQETPDDVGHLLLVGHNPGLEDLLLAVTEGNPNELRGEAEIKYPTATVATLEFPRSANWKEVAEGTGLLVRFQRPRDLDPALGPDS